VIGNRFRSVARTTKVALVADRDRTTAPPRQLSDEALLARVGHGDHDALGELYDRTARLVHALALRVTRSPELAEDATQDAFMAVWGRADTYRPSRGSARAWVLMIAHRRAVDRVRHEQRRLGLAEPLGNESHEALAPAADEEASVVLERERIGRALAALPDVERELIELAYYDGYTQSQLAQRLGLPLGTVKRRTFNGLARLRGLLEAEC
jgi:RNA polymerase sigma-70 factor (ECF subfamily)